MKILLVVAGLLIVTATVSLAAGAKTADELVAAYRTAVQEKSSEKIDALAYTVGMSDTDKRQAAAVRQMMFSNSEIASIGTGPLPADFQSVFIMRGKKIEPTHAPVGMIKITFKSGADGAASMQSPYTVVDGRYYLIGTKTTDLGWSGPPDKTIGYMVMGKGQEQVKIHVRWNASGVEQQKDAKEPSSSFVGQFIEEAVVTSEQADTDVTLTVLADGKPVFVSAPLKGKGTVMYKKE